MTPDLRLYALVDPAVAGGRTLPELAKLIAPATTIVQLRDKHGSTRDMVATARALNAVLKPAGIPLLINDRVDVALAAEADGVHIGQDDMAAADARRLLGPDAIIGLSIKSLTLAAEAPLCCPWRWSHRRRQWRRNRGARAAPIGTGGLRAIAAAI